MSFNFMAAVIICSDFGAQENKVCQCSHCFPIYLPLSDRTRYYDHFLNTNVYFMFYLNIYVYIYIGFPGSSAIEKQIRSLGWENPLEKEIATHSSILAWEIPWTAETQGLQFVESQRVRHNLVSKQQQCVCVCVSVCVSVCVCISNHIILN